MGGNNPKSRLRVSSSVSGAAFAVVSPLLQGDEGWFKHTNSAADFHGIASSQGDFAPGGTVIPVAFGTGSTNLKRRRSAESGGRATNEVVGNSCGGVRRQAANEKIDSRARGRPRRSESGEGFDCAAGSGSKDLAPFPVEDSPPIGQRKRKFERRHTQPEGAPPDTSSKDDASCSGTRRTRESTGPSPARCAIKAKRLRIQPYEKVFDMPGVRRARFCHNRKDAESTYLPAEDALYRLCDGAPRGGKLDLCGWGIRDIDMPGVATVILSNMDAKADTGGVTSLVLDRCWRLTDEGVEGLTRPLLATPNRVEGLSLAGCNLLTNKSAFHVYRSFHRLLSIDISGTGITDDGLQLILGAGKVLRSLGLRNLPGLTDRGLAAVLQCIKRRRQLQNLELCKSLRFTDDGLLALLSAGGLLRTLDIHGCSQLSELCLMGLERATFTSTQLRFLDVRGMAIADIGLGWVAQGCKLLESLNISRCPLLTDLALEYLAKGSGAAKSTPLKVLNLAGLGGITDEGIATLMPRSGLTLENLTLDGATHLGDDTVRSIARHCPNLKSLSMVELTRTSDRSFKELGRRCPRLRLLDSSSDINILETSHRTRVPKFGGDGVRELCVGTPSLVVLRLNGVCKITDDALVAVGANCALLEELCIRSCNLVTDAGLAAIARSCPHLRHVGAGGCVRLTDGSIRAVAIRAGGGLRVLDVAGCRGVTDASLEAIGQHCSGLESLTLQGCERVSDKGFALLLRGCPNLTALNLRGVPELTEASVAAVETHCRKLRRLSMEGIPQVSGTRVQLAAERLPLVAREPGTRLLRPCNLPCRVFNTHVQERAEWTAAAIAVQRIVRGQLCRLRWKRGEQRKAWAIMTLRNKLSSVMAKRLFRDRLRRRRAEHAAATVIQTGARYLLRRRRARDELARRKGERDAATHVQRAARGRRGRLMAKTKRWIRQRARDNWGWLVRRLDRQQCAIAHWRTSLSLAKCYRKLWKIARRHRQEHACRRVQRARRRLLRQRERARAEKAELERRIEAAAVIQRNWRSYYRSKWLMRDIRLREQAIKRQGFKREYAQIELAFWWRRNRAKHLKRVVLRELVVAQKAVAIIKRAYRTYIVKTMLVRAKKKAIAVRCRWRRFYLGVVRLPRPEDAIKIQRVFRRFFRRRRREKAATDIQRVYRGVLARRIFVVKLARMYTLNAIDIQRVGRGHIARRGKVRDALEASHAARVITRALRNYIINKNFQKMVKEALVKRAKFERLQREELMRQRAEAAISKALLMNQQRAAKAIQTRWRQRLARRRKEEEMLLKIEINQRMVLDKKLREKAIEETKRKQRGAVKKVGGALSALGRRFNKLTAQVDPELGTEDKIILEDDEDDEEQNAETRQKEKERQAKQEADVLANSILNHQTNSIKQVGICDMHITVGSKEQKAFSEAQNYLKATQQPFMRCVEGDLSGDKKQLRVHLWVMMGQGEGVISDVRAQRAPPNHANPAVAKVRRMEAQRAVRMLVGHSRCELELMCKVISRTEGTAPAVDDIVLCARRSDEAGLLDRGYEQLQPQLKTVGLGKGFLFIHRKTFKTRPKMLDVAKYRLKKSSWFTSHTALLLEKYALTEDEILELHSIFDRTDFKGNFTMDIYSFFSEMKETEARYGHWLLEAVGAGGSKTDISWDQYLEIVCFFCMFSRHEILRFVFGALDPGMRGYLNIDDFQKFLVAVTQHESGVPGNLIGKAKRGFTRLARSGTELEFPQFDKLCSQFPRLPHPIYRLQTSIQKQNLGETFWDKKKETFTRARKAVGVEKVN